MNTEDKKFEWNENKVDELLYHLTKKTRWVHSQMCDWKEEFKASQLPLDFEIEWWIPKDNVGYAVLLCGDYQGNLLEGYKIAKVKRLSDGETFSIGDEDKKGIIKEFRLVNNILMVFVEGKNTGGTIVTSLRKLSKPSKQPYKGVGFEILSYRNPLCVTDIKDGDIVSAPDNYAELKNYPINSVRRIEDNEVFSVGDKIGWGEVGTFECTIDSFRMKEGRLEIGYGQNKKFSEFYFVDIERAVKLHKIKPIPLFTTEQKNEIIKIIQETIKIQINNV